MTLLFFLKPNYHQGHSPPADDVQVDTGKRRKRKRAKKVTKQFVSQLSQTLDIPIPDVRGYIEDILAREAEVIRLKEEAIKRAEEIVRLRLKAEHDQRLKEALEEQRIAEEEERSRIEELIEQVGIMVRKAVIAKRKRLNMIIASILEWL